MPELPRERLLHLIACCEGRVQSIRLVPDLFGLASVGVEAEDLDGVLLLHMRWNLAKPWNLLVKRRFDLSVATGGRRAAGPRARRQAASPFALDSPGPVFFVQERLGRGRRRFGCVKFRTMYADNEARLRVHPCRATTARRANGRVRQAQVARPAGHPRRPLLRRSSLDELPQLINVMRGENEPRRPASLPAERDRAHGRLRRDHPQGAAAGSPGCGR